MSYKTTGTPKKGKNAPRHQEHNQHGTAEKPYGHQPSKTEMLARMKAAAKGQKKVGT